MSRRGAAATGVIASVMLLGALLSGGRQLVGQADYPVATPPLNPTIVACVLAHKQPICNPAVWPTQVAEDPLSRPPSANPKYISEAAAIQLARSAANSGVTPAAPASAVVHAKLMTRREYERMVGEYTSHNQDRKLWVVAVHADLQPAKGGNLFHSYTVAIDAELGFITDGAYPGDLVTGEGLVVPTPQGP